MTATNGQMVEVCQQLAETNAQQQKQINKLTEQLEKQVKQLSALNGQTGPNQNTKTQPTQPTPKLSAYRMCQICKTRHRGAGRQCFELEENKDKRPPGWVSRIKKEGETDE